MSGARQRGRRFAIGAICAAVLCAASAHGAAILESRPMMHRLPNGMRLIVAPRSFNKVLAMNLFLEGGSAEDPKGLEGLANLTQNLLIKGTASRDAETIAEEIESIGGQIQVSTSEDYTEIKTISVVEDLETVLELMADVTMRPAFAPDEIEKERAQALSRIRRVEDDQFGYAYREFTKALYENHPYGHPVEGEEDSVRSIERQDIVGFHDRHLLAQRMVLSVCGDVDPAEMARAATAAFGDFGPPREVTVIRVSRNARARFHNIELSKDCQQAFVIAGFPAATYSNDDYPALRVANAMLGEGMSARLFRNLRDERSLAYSVGSALGPKMMGGHLVMWIGTNPRNAEEARLALLDEARRLADDGTAEEFERAKQYVIGKHLIARQSNGAKAHALGMFEMLGVGHQYDERFPQLIRAVTRSEALAALKRYAKTSTSVTLAPSGNGAG